MKHLIAMLAAFALTEGVAVTAHAQVQPAPGAVPQAAVTHHTGVFGSKTVAYSAAAGLVDVAGSGGAPIARIFSTAYTADAGGPARPVIFAYNGGPGSASAFLHLGALGPVRAVFPTDLSARPAPPFALTPNVYSPLDVADVVLIDPPETGFSHTQPGDATKSYATILGDAEIVADFIRAWVKANGREASPKYILGESYGATRTALVTGDLLKTNGGKAAIHLAGVVLVSQMLTVDDLGPRPMNAAGYASALPSIAAIAWYHGRVDHRGRTFEAFVAEAQHFAILEYMPALMLGHDLPEPQRERLAIRLAGFSGLSKDAILAHDLQIDVETYRRALFPGRLLGGYDGRYVGAPPSPGGETIADPAQRQTTPIVDATIGRYLRDTLKVEAAGPYVLENRALGGSWNFGDKRRAPATTYLTDYLAKEPDAYVMVASGYHDLVTPFATGKFLVAHLPLKPGHGEFHAYPGGHMFYSGEPSLAAFSHDLHLFVARTAAASHLAGHLP